MMNQLQEALEQAVIGAALMETSLGAHAMGLYEKMGVTERWFRSPEAQRVWPLMWARWQKVHAVQADVLLSSDAGVDPAWLKQCLDNAPVAKSAVSELAERFATEWQRSIAVEVGRTLMRDAVDLDPNQAVAQASTAILGYYNATQSSSNAQEEMRQEQEQILADYRLLHQKRVVEGDKTFFLGAPLPFAVLNQLYGSVRPGLHCIGARPSQGKTALAVTLSVGMAAQGIKQLFFSVDMPREEVLKRYASFLSQTSLTRMELGASAEDLANFEEGMKRFNALGNPSKGTTIKILKYSHIDRVVNEIYRAVKCEGVRVVWLDYLQVFEAARGRTQKEQVDDVLKKLKQCAVELKIPIFCLCQLNRESGKEVERRPMLTDLGDSGRIERDASTVLLLWREPEVMNRWQEAPPLALAGGERALAMSLAPTWLILAKNQQGRTNNLPFVMYQNTFMFRPADHEARPVKKGKTIDSSPCFSKIRDDFMILEKPDGSGLDDKIKRHGALGKRGL